MFSVKGFNFVNPFWTSNNFAMELIKLIQLKQNIGVLFFFLNLETLFPEEAESYFRGLLVEKVDF